MSTSTATASGSVARVESDEASLGPAATNARGFGRVAMRVSFLTGLTQIFSFVSSIVIAHVLGATSSTDAYFLGYSVPIFVSSVFLAAVRAGAIPALTDEAAEGGRAFVRASGELVSITLISTIVLSVLTAAVAVALLPLISGNPKLVGSAQRDAVALAPLGLFGAMVSALAAILAVRNRFAAAALVIGIDPLLRIGLLLLFGSSLGTNALVIANDVGNGLAVVVMWVLVLRDGIPLKVTWSLRSKFVRRSLAVTVPMVLAQAAVSTNPVIDRAMTGKLGAGSITALELGLRLFGIPLTLIGATLVGPLTATWAARKAAGGWVALRDSVNRGIDTFTMVVPPLIVLGIVMRHQVVSLIYHGGGYSAHATNQTASVLAMCELGAPAMLVGIAFATLYVIEGRMKFVLLTGVINFGLNAFLDFVLRTPLGVAGIALGTSITYTVVLGIYIGSTRRRWPGVRIPFSGRTGIRTIFASGVMTAAALALTSVLSAQSNRLRLGGEIIAVSVLAVAAYLVVLLNREQRRSFIAGVQRRLARSSWIGGRTGEAGSG